MACEWRETSLGDLIDIKHGFAFKGQFIHDEPSGDVLLTPGNFSIGGGFKSDKLKYYDGSVPDEFVLREGDLLVTMTDLSKQSDTLGFPAFIPPSPNGRRYLHNQRLGKVSIREPTETSARYIFYVMCGAKYRDEVLASAAGTTVRHTSPNRIRQFRFLCAPPSEQRVIARILGALDDKIDLNRRLNETLEAIAWALFKDWFVDFGPVRAKAEGRDPCLPRTLAGLYPAQLVDSELGEIPEGWGVGTLGEVAENLRRSVRPSQINPDTAYIALEHMPKRCIALSDWATGNGIESNKFEFKRGEILFGKLRPYFHKVGVAPTDGVCSTDIVVVRPRQQASFGFVLGHVSSAEFVDYTDAGSMGTRMPRTNWNEMARYQLALPPAPIDRSFGILMRPTVERIIGNIHESLMLTTVRDALLPKLISGEMGLRDAEKAVEAVA